MAKLKLDWKAYFQEFCLAHGGDPLVYMENKETGLGGYLLFPDGWMYSRSDYSGPEYPPTSPEDARLKFNHYWSRRRDILLQELKDRLAQLEDLTLKQDRYSAPLVQRVEYRTEDDSGQTKLQVASEPLDLASQLAELRGLQAAYQECLSRLSQGPEPTPAITRTTAVTLAELNSIREQIRGT